jgi:hypothetical protein
MALETAISSPSRWGGGAHQGRMLESKVREEADRGPCCHTLGSWIMHLFHLPPSKSEGR